MQTVSEKWKHVHEQSLLNESFVEISMDIADPESLAVATSQDNGAVYISDSSQVVSEVEKTIVPYCTLEQNLWLLDGSRQIIPEGNHEESGYVGDVLSDDFCVFSSKIPTITIEFGGETFFSPIPGITITWSNTHNEFADSFIVKVYNNETIVAEKEVMGNRSVTTLVMMNIEQYNRIVIHVTKWCLPYHRARVEEIFVGMHKVYTKSNLFNYSHKQSVDRLSTSLPKNEINFSIDNVNGEYNPNNPQGLSKYLMERQEVKARYGLKLNNGSVEWIKGGTFYLSDWYAKQNGITADFTARDLLEFLSDIYEDSITEITERSLYDLALNVLESSKLPLNRDGTVKWAIDESLKSISTTAPLPQDTRANCLQLIANAAESVLYQDRTGTLRIEPLVYNDETYEINSFNSYSKPEQTLSKPIKGVRVKVYTYAIGEDGSIESKTRGKKGSRPRIIPAGGTGEVIEIDNPLVTDNNRANALADWLYTYLYYYRHGLDFSWRADVRLDVLDVIESPHEYNVDRVCMTELEFKYNGAFRGTGKGTVI